MNELGKLENPKEGWNGWNREREGKGMAGDEVGDRQGSALNVTLGAGFHSEKEGEAKEKF